MSMVCSQCKRPVGDCCCSIDPQIVAAITTDAPLPTAFEASPRIPGVRWFVTYRVRVWDHGRWSTKEENRLIDRHPLAWLANGAPEGSVILWWTEVPAEIADALWR